MPVELSRCDGSRSFRYSITSASLSIRLSSARSNQWPEMSPTLEAAHGEMTKVIVSAFSATVTVKTGWGPGVPLEAPLMLDETDDIPLLLRTDQPCLTLTSNPCMTACHARSIT